MSVVTNRKVLLLFLHIFGLLSFSFAQQKTLNYTILNKRDSVGNLQAIQKISGDEEQYIIMSAAETKLLMSIKVNVQEESRYHKSRLLFSSLKRTMNGKVKVDKQTKAVSNGYLITDDGKESKLSLKSIGYNFSKIYFIEPVGISQIYSDNYQKMLPIKAIRNHVYQVDLPEGGPNTYYYENGVCRMIDVRGSLFNGQLVLNK